MREYSNKISLVRNGRGVYCIDTTMGCNSGLSIDKNGCYGDCYAARTAKRYGYDFNKTVLRDFESIGHYKEVIKQISLVKMPFIRIGSSGDPSENWEHTLKIINLLKNCNKEIVIITRHWNILTDDQLKTFSTLNICINTSVSALDSVDLINHSLTQYERIKPYCKSILRVVSCKFNIENETGNFLNNIQKELFKNDSVLDTVFRPSKNNKFLKEGIILAENQTFNGSKQLASKYKTSTYMGGCSTCHEMCGINIKAKMPETKMGILKQGNIFKKNLQNKK